jgi:hypothetical protein
VVPLVALVGASSSDASRRPIRLRLIGTPSTRAASHVIDSNSLRAGGWRLARDELEPVALYGSGLTPRSEDRSPQRLTPVSRGRRAELGLGTGLERPRRRERRGGSGEKHHHTAHDEPAEQE